MNKSLTALFVPLLVLSLMGLGCNPFASVQKKIENKIGQTIGEKILEGASGGKGDVTITDDGVTVKNKETGESMGFGADAKIPDGFPSDIPRYGGSAIALVSLSSDAKSAMLAVTIDGKTLAELSEWYDAKLTTSGYERTTQVNSSELVMNEYKKNKITLSLVVTSGETDGKLVSQVQITRDASGE